VFAEGQAAVVADRIIAEAQGRAAPATYDGHGMCYLEFGGDLVGRVDVTFLSGAAPVGGLEGPSRALAADKAAFGTSRIERWFDRIWDGGR
jgi:sulfide:quinone oxidoreductase